MAIDLHSHYFPLSVVDRLPATMVEVVRHEDGAQALTVAGHNLPLNRHLTDLAAQMRDLERQQLSARTLMVPPFTCGTTLVIWSHM